jgi:hypothetical protein
MKRPVLTLVLAASLCAIAAPVHAKTILESTEKTYPGAALQALHVNFTVGKLRVEGTDAKDVTVRLLVHCKGGRSKCDELTRDVTLDAHTRGDRLDLDIEGHSLFDSDDYWIEGVIELPRRMRLDIEMPVGEVEIDGMANDVDLRLKVGEVMLGMSEDAVSRIEAGVTIGEASLDKSDGRQQVEGLFTSKLRWNEGKGRARVNVELGVGELNMRLY